MSLLTTGENSNSITVSPANVGLPEHIPQEYSAIWPDTLTLITTYTCNAACTECCFGCNPNIQGRLSLQSMLNHIDEAHAGFPALKLVVFTGGECFLLKQDLFSAIAHAHQLGLSTRCVTNGFWGKAATKCKQTVNHLVNAGINEINISTGLDHQEWVPQDSVVKAATALVEAGVFTLITIEADTADSNCRQRLLERPEIRKLLKQPNLFRVQNNSWMPFTVEHQSRTNTIDRSDLTGGCGQVFHNAVVTPSEELSACCGLTLEHIPEMKIGFSGIGGSLSEHYYRQYEDFLKIWLSVDGPFTIMTRLIGDEADDAMREKLAAVVHICQACVILHQHPRFRQLLEERYQEFVPEIMSRFYLEQAIQVRQIQLS